MTKKGGRGSVKKAEEAEVFIEKDEVQVEETEEVRASEEWVSRPSGGAKKEHKEVMDGVLCPLCLDGNIAEPIILHNSKMDYCVACRTCVENWIKILDGVRSESLDEFQYECPVCSKLCDNNDFKFASTLTAPVGSAVRNKTLLDTCAETMQVSSETNTKDLCGICEEKKSSSMCLQCDFPLCDECCSTTHSKGKFKTHEVVSLAAARKGEQRKRKCDVHRENLIDLYCKDCSLCICVSCCFAGIHKGHDVVPLEEVAQKTRTRVQSLSAALRDQYQRSDVASEALSGILPQYQSVVEGVQSEIKMVFSSLIETLKSREGTLLDQVEQQTSLLRGELSEKSALGATISEGLKKTVQALEDNVSNLHPVTLMTIIQDVENRCHDVKEQTSVVLSRLELLEKAFLTRLVGAKDLVEFTLLDSGDSVTQATVQYSQLLSKLGEVRVVDSLEMETNTKEYRMDNAIEEENDSTVDRFYFAEEAPSDRKRTRVAEEPTVPMETEESGPQWKESDLQRPRNDFAQPQESRTTGGDYRFSNGLEIGVVRRTEPHTVNRNTAPTSYAPYTNLKNCADPLSLRESLFTSQRFSNLENPNETRTSYLQFDLSPPGKMLKADSDFSISKRPPSPMKELPENESMRTNNTKKNDFSNLQLML